MSETFIARNEVAVPLLCALVDHVARDEQLRTLAIKGPVFRADGLRKHASQDADVLVHPADFEAFLAAMARRGWSDTREPSTTRAVMDPHSVTIVHPRWPVSLDVHRYFPGHLAEPTHVFDQLWSTRREATVADRQVLAPDLPHSAVLWGVNVLRDGVGVHTGRQDDWCDWVVSHDLSAEVVAAAVSTGATETLGPLLERLDVPVPAPVHTDPVKLRQWRLNQQGDTRGLGLLLRLRESSPLRWPGLLKDGLWPTDGTPAENRARLRNGLRRAPTIVRRFVSAAR